MSIPVKPKVKCERCKRVWQADVIFDPRWIKLFYFVCLPMIAPIGKCPSCGGFCYSFPKDTKEITLED